MADAYADSFGFLGADPDPLAALFSSPAPLLSQPTGPNPDTTAGTIPEAGTEPHSAPSALLEVIGNTVGIPEPIPFNLSEKQKRYIELYSRQLTVKKELVTGQAIWDLWPAGYAKGRVSSVITDPVERAKVARVGQRPMIGDIQGYLETTDYAEQMKELGIEVNTKATGLTTEQMGFITYFSNYTDGKNIRQKLKDSGVSWSKFQAWRAQPVFARYYDELLGESIKDAIPFAKQQIAAKMGAGDISAIKFGMELTGDYDPRGQQQVDARQLVTVILEVLEEKIKDPAILLDIAASITLKSQAIGTGPHRNG